MKNKIITTLIISFSLFFLSFIVLVTVDLSRSNDNILKSKNVIAVGDLISTRLKVSNHDLSNKDKWVEENFNDRDWLQIKIPNFKIVQLDDFREGSFAYYRIKLPKKSFERISHLQNETYLVLQSVFFHRFDIYLNGKFYQTYRPQNPGENRVVIPVKESSDNLIAIKGFIHTGDTGIDSRNKIMLGKGLEFNAIHSANYKGQTVFQLVFILCKGSILFIFGLIFLLLRVDKSFDKFFIFGLCALFEELIAGDYFYGPLNFNQMVYFYNLVNIGGAISAFLFFGQLTGLKIERKFNYILLSVLIFVSFALAIDALYWNLTVDISKFMKFWNLLTVTILIYFIPRIYRLDKILFVGVLMSVVLYLWGAFFSKNIGLNLKAYGNLLLFFLVAYQTFALFRREQVQLQLNEKLLSEQEKDVAIGKTASLLAHDVRKPLEQIKLVIDKISAGQIDREFLEIAKNDIELSIAGVNHQVNDIINFSKTSKVTFSEISFYRLLSHALKQTMSVHQEMNIIFEYEFNSNFKILGDQLRLSNAMVNLLANSVEAIRDLGSRFDGKVKISTSTLAESFLIKIFNDGPEIPENILTDIFKPLFTYGKANGTGLGLASVVKTINEHQGSIEIRNVLGRGVEYILQLRKSSEMDIPNLYDFKLHSKYYSYNVSPVNGQESKIIYRILVLEDESSEQENIRTLIFKSSFKSTIEFATNAEEATELINKKRFDFYLLKSSIGGKKIKEELIPFLSTEVIVYSDKVFSEFIERLKLAFSRRPTLLFVDDTKLFRVAWSMFHGEHNIECAETPEKAISLIKSYPQRFDIFVVDFHFSNSSMNGIVLAKKIKEINPNALVLISSSLQEKDFNFETIKKNDFEVRRYASNKEGAL